MVVGVEENIEIFLEPLDVKGRTIRDPQPLTEKFEPRPDYKKSENFPFRQD